MEGGGCACWWLQAGSEEMYWGDVGRPSLLAWTTLDARWLHCRVALTWAPMALRPLRGGVTGWRSRHEPPSLAPPVPLGSAPIRTLIPPSVSCPWAYLHLLSCSPCTVPPFTSPCSEGQSSDASSRKPSLTLLVSLGIPLLCSSPCLP